MVGVSIAVASSIVFTRSTHDWRLHSRDVTVIWLSAWIDLFPVQRFYRPDVLQGDIYYWRPSGI